MATAKEVFSKALENEKVKYQLLSNCVDDVSIKKGVTTIRFGTKCADISDVVDNRSVVGVVLWIPRDVYNEASK